LEGGEDDVVAIAEMVCLLQICTVTHIFTATGVTKRCIKCSIWWHQRFERSHPGLDYTSGSITQPTSCSKCQARSRISPWPDWCSPLSCRNELGWARVWFTTTFLIVQCWFIYRTRKKLKDGEMVIPGDQWPVFLYAGYMYDPEDPWKGLFRSPLLISVGCPSTTEWHIITDSVGNQGLQTCLHLSQLCR
jgi:hypothetical protein